MSQADNGGPAFPVCEPAMPQGMSQRDWFAGQALQGLITTDRQFTHSIPAVARLAYDYADAMLAARRKS